MVVPGPAAHQQRSQDAGAEQENAEGVADHGGDHTQVGHRLGHFHTHGLVQEALEQEGGHAHRQGGGIQVEALMYDGGIVQASGNKESGNQANGQGHGKTGGRKSHHLRIGVADQQLGNKGSKAGGEQHGIGMVADLLLPLQAVQHHTQHGGPHIQDMDAPGAEAGGEDGHQGGGMVGLFAGDAV